MSSSHHDSHGVQEQPTQCLCAAGCGFYSNVGTGGLCSKCHREAQHQLEAQQQQQQHKLQQQQQPDASTTASAAVPSPAPEAPAQGPSSAATPLLSQQVEVAVATKKPSPTRCWTCNKKVGLTGFSCKCEEGAVFCSTHRYAEAHACAFDYKALAKQQLEAKNPLVQASKVDRI